MDGEDRGCERYSTWTADIPGIPKSEVNPIRSNQYGACTGIGIAYSLTTWRLMPFIDRWFQDGKHETNFRIGKTKLKRQKCLLVWKLDWKIIFIKISKAMQSWKNYDLEWKV